MTNKIIRSLPIPTYPQDDRLGERWAKMACFLSVRASTKVNKGERNNRGSKLITKRKMNKKGEMNAKRAINEKGE